MRTLKRHKQKMYYSLMGTDEDRVPIFDYYRDDDGNEYKIESGEYIIPYLSPEEFSGNIAMSVEMRKLLNLALIQPITKLY